jgi:hypothetical protein
MTEYLVKVHFWLLSSDSVTIEASSDFEAIEKAKGAAVTVMDSHACPETIDFDERREGSISYIDRIEDDERDEVEGVIQFDTDRLYPSWHDFIGKIAALSIIAVTDDAGKAEALRQYHALIEEAKTLRDHIA